MSTTSTVRRSTRATGVSARLRRSALAIALLAAAGPALALDLAALDRVSVLMSRTEVRGIAGVPEDITSMPPDLTLETYAMTDTPGMIGAGFIFEPGGTLVGQSFVFPGAQGPLALELMQKYGFKIVRGNDGIVRLSGADDDTRRPLIATVDDRGDTTTVVAYEENEYARRARLGAAPADGATAAQPLLPLPAAAPVQPVAPAPRAGSANAAAAASLAAGLGLLAGQMKPIQKSTTISSSSSTSVRPDGTVVTRSSSTSVGVSVDPAGLANALQRLLTQ
jgi:hypothetical protein